MKRQISLFISIVFLICIISSSVSATETNRITIYNLYDSNDFEQLIMHPEDSSFFASNRDKILLEYSYPDDKVYIEERWINEQGECYDEYYYSEEDGTYLKGLLLDQEYNCLKEQNIRELLKKNGVEESLVEYHAFWCPVLWSFRVMPLMVWVKTTNAIYFMGAITDGETQYSQDILAGKVAGGGYFGLKSYTPAEMQQRYGRKQCKILFEGKELESDPAVVLKNGTALLPLRKICELAGANTIWKDTLNGGYILLEYGNTSIPMYFSGREFPMDISSEMPASILIQTYQDVNDRFYLYSNDMKAILTRLGYNFELDIDTGVIQIQRDN